jgi:predicted deacylase
LHDGILVHAVPLARVQRDEVALAVRTEVRLLLGFVAGHQETLHAGDGELKGFPDFGKYPSLEAARHFGLPVLWRLPETDGVLSCEFHRRGKTAIGCEYLGAGQLSRDGVEAYRRGILSCLALWGLLPGETPLAPGGEPFTGDWMLAEATGQFFAETELGDLVEPGRLLATIRDIRGDVLQSFAAPHAGIVLAIRSKAYIRSGDWGILVATHA